jgi:hypothetical protein
LVRLHFEAARRYGAALARGEGGARGRDRLLAEGSAQERRHLSVALQLAYLGAPTTFGAKPDAATLAPRGLGRLTERLVATYAAALALPMPEPVRRVLDRNAAEESLALRRLRRAAERRVEAFARDRSA